MPSTGCPRLAPLCGCHDFRISFQLLCSVPQGKAVRLHGCSHNVAVRPKLVGRVLQCQAILPHRRLDDLSVLPQGLSGKLQQQTAGLLEELQHEPAVGLQILVRELKSFTTAAHGGQHHVSVRLEGAACMAKSHSIRQDRRQHRGSVGLEGLASKLQGQARVLHCNQDDLSIGVHLLGRILQGGAVLAHGGQDEGTIRAQVVWNHRQLHAGYGHHFQALLVHRVDADHRDIGARAGGRRDI
mmetsp:Transcript_16725/g.46342  ORF Transcript_16725/g.46342 Transcript_16725/m.46342 type:complete len:241 (-) Transcript_16725:381-1103(-)